jgi:7-cyano-7-deazaguanine reductase
MDDLKQLGKPTVYPQSPEEAELDTFENKVLHRKYTVTCHCPEFTHICPITGQPDFAHITITYVPDKKCIESKSLKLYLASFRNSGTFHEAVTNRILDDIIKAADPHEVTVTGKFNTRGGISIDVVAEHKKSEL